MTIRQLYIFNSLYLILLVIVVILTRASLRRFAGALVGAFAAGGAAIAVIAFCERAGWWHFKRAICIRNLWADVVFVQHAGAGAIDCGGVYGAEEN